MTCLFCVFNKFCNNTTVIISERNEVEQLLPWQPEDQRQYESSHFNDTGNLCTKWDITTFLEGNIFGQQVAEQASMSTIWTYLHSTHASYFRPCYNTPPLPLSPLILPVSPSTLSLPPPLIPSLLHSLPPPLFSLKDSFTLIIVPQAIPWDCLFMSVLHVCYPLTSCTAFFLLLFFCFAFFCFAFFCLFFFCIFLDNQFSTLWQIATTVKNLI